MGYVSAWGWGADLAEQLPLYGSVGTGLAFLLALCIRWWRREDDNIANERARSIDALREERTRSIEALKEVKDEHRRALDDMADRTDKLEEALGILLSAADDPVVRAQVTTALWPKRGSHDGP